MGRDSRVAEHDYQYFIDFARIQQQWVEIDLTVLSANKHVRVLSACIVIAFGALLRTDLIPSLSEVHRCTYPRLWVNTLSSSLPKGGLCGCFYH